MAPGEPWWSWQRPHVFLYNQKSGSERKSEAAVSCRRKAFAPDSESGITISGRGSGQVFRKAHRKPNQTTGCLGTFTALINTFYPLPEAALGACWRLRHERGAPLAPCAPAAPHLPSQTDARKPNADARIPGPLTRAWILFYQIHRLCCSSSSADCAGWLGGGGAGPIHLPSVSATESGFGRGLGRSLPPTHCSTHTGA